jgi:hypothetical protein
MTKPIIRIHNTDTDEVIDREMTEAEYKTYLAEQEIAAKYKQDYLDQAALKEAAQVKLAALGLTADDLKALGL